MNPTTRDTETIVVDAETGNIYEVFRPDSLTYSLSPIIGDQIIELDEWGYWMHFKRGIFKYCGRG